MCFFCNESLACAESREFASAPSLLFPAILRIVFAEMEAFGSWSCRSLAELLVIIVVPAEAVLAALVVCVHATEPASISAPAATPRLKYPRVTIHILSIFHNSISTPPPQTSVDTTSAAPSASSCGHPHAVVQTIYSSLLRQI
jgi:hypothetical protein